MATTTNFGWTTPDDTDLVKDGASAIRTLGSAIDTSLVDLKGGTTGQALTKASNADMDFTWAAIDPLLILDQKGDLISATAADTPARLAVGTNGQVLTANSATSTGLEWTTISSGGGFTSLASGSLSGSTLNLTTISQSYQNLRLILRDIFVASNTQSLTLRFENDSGSNYYYLTGRYSNVTWTARTGTSIALDDGISGYSNTNEDSVMIIDIFDYANTSTRKAFECNLAVRDQNPAINIIKEIGIFATVGAIDEINLATTSGNFGTGGTYELFGVK